MHSMSSWHDAEGDSGTRGFEQVPIPFQDWQWYFVLSFTEEMFVQPHILAITLRVAPTYEKLTASHIQTGDFAALFDSKIYPNLVSVPWWKVG